MAELEVAKSKESTNVIKAPVYEAHSYDHQRFEFSVADKRVFDFLIKENNKTIGPKFTLAILPDKNDGFQRFQFFESGRIVDGKLQNSSWVGNPVVLPKKVSAEDRNEMILSEIKSVLGDRLISLHGKLPDDFTPEVKKQLQKIPLEILEDLDKNNYRVNILERLDMLKEDSAQNFTGKASTSSMAYIPGITNPKNNAIFIASKVIIGENKEISTVPILAQTIAHEIGHVASDLIAEKYTNPSDESEVAAVKAYGISSSLQFKKAYILDCAQNSLRFDNLDPTTKERASYYLEAGHKKSTNYALSTATDRAMTECFAECFSTLLIGHKETFEGAYFVELFPESIEAVREIVKDNYKVELSVDAVGVNDLVMPKVGK